MIAILLTNVTDKIADFCSLSHDAFVTAQYQESTYYQEVMPMMDCRTAAVETHAFTGSQLHKKKVKDKLPQSHI